MPCDIDEHTHVWPVKGQLIIEKCERYCQFCTGDHAKHHWKFAWFLRRHVKAVHVNGGDYPEVIVSDGW